MIRLEHSLSTPEQQANLLTRAAFRNGIDASTFDVVAENLRVIESNIMTAFLNDLRITDTGEPYHEYRLRHVTALLERES